MYKYSPLHTWYQKEAVPGVFCVESFSEAVEADLHLGAQVDVVIHHLFVVEVK